MPVPGITVGHEMVGVVERLGEAVQHGKSGGSGLRQCRNLLRQLFFSVSTAMVNNCTDPAGRLGPGVSDRRGTGGVCPGPVCRSGAQSDSRYGDDEQALFVGDILATGYWAARISDIQPEDTVLILGAGPTGLCTYSVWP